ncbi:MULTISPECIES: hypothetical protein [unclassified Achromobacter]|uniref:hypothetical protein n=1 Tax=unclassified Achromobacter TaxID=2626865 RepID=UPI000B51C281|nr:MULTISPECIES: hypothetical protein [unclassified Achromobacter]OWT69197.1 hypothetical protein CEY05_28640 [Achromobacter sp. HZ34]OWT70602.1 hypothetical protein CEY04_27470 [Achromobacter sp. HZ28]
MSLTSRAKAYQFFAKHRPTIAAFTNGVTSTLIAVAGGITGYSIAHIEAVHLLQAQAARHTQEILQVRDQYGAKAQDTRDAVKQAADATSDAAKATAKIAEQMAAPASTAKKEAAKAQQAASDAKDAADRARAAEQKVQQIFPPGYKPPIPDRDPRIPADGDVPDWLNVN